MMMGCFKEERGKEGGREGGMYRRRRREFPFS